MSPLRACGSVSKDEKIQGEVINIEPLVVQSMRCNRPVHHEGCVFGHGHVYGSEKYEDRPGPVTRDQREDGLCELV